MLPDSLQMAVENALADSLGSSIRLHAAEPVGGGCIHNAQKLETNAGEFFLKYNRVGEKANFQAEMAGLLLLGDAATLRVPKAISVGETGNHAFLLMEYIPTGARRREFWEEFGMGLAALHRQSAEGYGLDHANYIGRLPQRNTWKSTWVDFFIEERLETQLRLAERKGLASSKLRSQFEALYPRLSALMPVEPPSLLHGDLWSGNFMTDGEGHPTLIDPAVYFGHREIEIAFTQLFGGFSSAFYEAYHAAWPLQAGWQERVDLFNLYPLTVHLNLFGTGYLPQIQSILRRFT